MPVILEAYTDPNVPTLPPHISFEQAVTFSQALLKGESGELGMIRQTAKEVLSAVLPGK